MTDLSPSPSVPSQLGVTLVETTPTLVARLEPTPASCHLGRVRAAAVVFLADVVAGLQVDTDPDRWAFTSDLSLRLPDQPAPARLDARATVLRAGTRSSTSTVALTDGDGRPFGRAVAGFARVPRREGDPDKPALDLEGWREAWAAIPVLTRPLRDVAGVVATDPARGEVSVEVTPELRNPAGALQGAMVALLAECAAEDLATHHSGRPRVVTELDVRFLFQAREGRVRARAEPIGDPAAGVVDVTLVHEDTGRTVAQVFARAVEPADPG